MILEIYPEKFGGFIIPIAVLYTIFVGTPLLGAYLPPFMKVKQNISDKMKK